MQVMRKGVFETNSSSSHSLTLSEIKPKKQATLFVEADGVCTIYEGEFGWGVDMFTDAETKASYLYTYIRRIAKPKMRKRLLRQLRDLIKKNTKCAAIKFSRDIAGYIDHQSADTAEYLFDRDEYLENFIYNPHSELFISNDNI